jgi:peptidoglycan hydrolase-like protein with peptidoglycan-binding domain
MKAGDRGPHVRALEQRLADLRFDPGPVDEAFDANTAHAVTAFQKLTGLPRTGEATPEVQQALVTAQPPQPLVPTGAPDRVEVDLARQVLMLYKGGALTKILPVSTGTGKRYCEEGECGIAVTPTGTYRVTSRVSGWQKSPLGRLYNPVYFNRGIAFHGYPTVPTQPASHGCVRIPMGAAEWFPGQVPEGTAVYVSDGTTPLQP